MDFVRRAGLSAGCVLVGISLLTGYAVAKMPQRVGQLADFEVYDRTSREALPVYWHRGRAYIVGKPGNEYQIRVSNRSNGAILGVISVDGVNVLTGDTAEPSQNGYVFEAGKSYSIGGWRKSQSETAAFYFTSISDSYAGRTGRPANVGVIGMAVFKEKPPVPEVNKDLPMRKMAPPMAQSEKSDGSFSLGTGHGRLERSEVTSVSFERASKRPVQVLTLYYDSYENLAARGIIPRSQGAVRPPQAFPGKIRFVPDPP